MDINITTNLLKGFQTTDGGTKYRRVQAIEVGGVNQTGLLEVESKYSTDGKGVGRLLVRCEMPYFTANTASCCCSDQEQSVTYAQAGKITFHTVLTLPKGAIADLKSANAPLAANQIAAIMGLTLGMSNTIGAETQAALANFSTSGVLKISADASDLYGILSPSGAVIRGVMGVTPIPAEGFVASPKLLPVSML